MAALARMARGGSPRALRFEPQLQQLHVGTNAIGNDGTRALKALLRFVPQLQRLSVKQQWYRRRLARVRAHSQRPCASCRACKS
jgi:hypothetical protein